MQVTTDTTLLPVDPAMLDDQTEEDDSEYEYEYDETESETFYVNLDLTSHNGLIRPPRRRQQSSTSVTPPQTLASGPGSPVSSVLLDEDNNIVTVEEGDDGVDDQIQILDLHSRNPIVSYRNQIFSCAWANMIGTELLFTHPEPGSVPSDLPCLKRDRDFDLIAANGVKILGRKAKLISSTGPRGNGVTARFPTTENLNPISSEPPPGDIPTAAKTKGQRSNQARFLERLMNAKHAKGEKDIVRTVFSLKRSQNFEDRLRGWARTEERMAEIRKLHQDALHGDMDALVALEDIYAQVEGGDEPSGPRAEDQDQDEAGTLPPSQ